MALVIGCPTSSLSAVINGTADGRLKPSNKLKNWKKTKQIELGRVDLRKYQSLDGAVKDSSRSLGPAPDQEALMQDELKQFSSMSLENVIEELIGAETSEKQRRIYKQKLEGHEEIQVRRMLAQRRLNLHES
jgi:hypothetical protein